MQVVILVMRRKSIAQGLVRMLMKKSTLSIYFEPDYVDVDDAIRSIGAKVALIEVAEYDEYGISYCLALCSCLRKETPDCKLILMCSEKDEKCVDEVVSAKKNRCIDDFVFYDTSVEYIAAKLAVL